MAHNYKACLTVEGATGFRTTYRQTPHSAVNAAYKQALDRAMLWRHGPQRCVITLYRRVPARTFSYALSFNYRFSWALVCTLSVYDDRFLGEDTRGHEFRGDFPLPKWENPGSNIIQG